MHQCVLWLFVVQKLWWGGGGVVMAHTVFYLVEYSSPICSTRCIKVTTRSHNIHHCQSVLSIPSDLSMIWFRYIYHVYLHHQSYTALQRSPICTSLIYPSNSTSFTLLACSWLVSTFSLYFYLKATLSLSAMLDLSNHKRNGKLWLLIIPLVFNEKTKILVLFEGQWNSNYSLFRKSRKYFYFCFKKYRKLGQAQYYFFVRQKEARFEQIMKTTNIRVCFILFQMKWREQTTDNEETKWLKSRAFKEIYQRTIAKQILLEKNLLGGSAALIQPRNKLKLW